MIARYSMAASRMLHWGIALAVLGALVSGYALTRPGAYSATVLQAHLTFGGTAGLFSLLRVLSWVSVGAPPPVFLDLTEAQRVVSRWVHILLRLVPLLLLVSGAGMIALSGAIEAVVDGTLTGLGVFEPLPPRRLHHAAALLLTGLIGLHGLATLWHVWQRPRLRNG